MDEGPDLEETTRELMPSEALEILRRISDEDCRRLGFSPEFSRWVLVLGVAALYMCAWAMDIP